MSDPLVVRTRSEPEGVSAADRSDRYLLQLLRERNPEAATALYARYSHRLRALIRSRWSSQLAQRLDPDDIVQSVFFRFFSAAERGDYEVPDQEELWGLLFVIALNKIRAAEKHHRAQKRDLARASMSLRDDDLPQMHGTDDGEDMFVLRTSISEALTCLSDLHRQVVELRIAGYVVAEISELVARSQRTVERVLQESRSQLRDFLYELD